MSDLERALDATNEIEHAASIVTQRVEPTRMIFMTQCERIEKAMGNDSHIAHRCEAIRGWAGIFSDPNQEEIKREEARGEILRNAHEIMVMIRSQTASDQ
jgi:hypothetical protein